MGAIHNELRRGSLSKMLTRVLGDTRGSTGLERYSETLQPVCDVYGLPEWAAMRDEARWAHYLVSNLVAAEYSGVALVNPANSGFLIVVESCSSYTAAAGAALVQRTDWVTLASSGYAAGTAPSSTDTRVPLGTNVGFLAAGSSAILAIGTVMEYLYPAAQGSIRPLYALPYIMSPGNALLLSFSVVNTATRGGFAWRERRLLPGELV